MTIQYLVPGSQTQSSGVPSAPRTYPSGCRCSGLGAPPTAGAAAGLPASSAYTAHVPDAAFLVFVEREAHSQQQVAARVRPGGERLRVPVP